MTGSNLSLDDAKFTFLATLTVLGSITCDWEDGNSCAFKQELATTKGDVFSLVTAKDHNPPTDHTVDTGKKIGKA